MWLPSSFNIDWFYSVQRFQNLPLLELSFIFIVSDNNKIFKKWNFFYQRIRPWSLFACKNMIALVLNISNVIKRYTLLDLYVFYIMSCENSLNLSSNPQNTHTHTHPHTRPCTHTHTILHICTEFIPYRKLGFFNDFDDYRWTI